VAESYKNAKAVLLDTATDIYIVPAGTTGIVIGCQITNVGTSANALEIWWVDSSDTNAVTRLGKDIDVPAKSSYEPIGGKLILEAGDKIVGTSGTASELEATVSVLEIS
jgi:hypothetical protein